jgi:hypothetical protein
MKASFKIEEEPGLKFLSFDKLEKVVEQIACYDQKAVIRAPKQVVEE